MEQGSRQLSGGSSFRPAVVLPVTCSVQKRLPLDMSVAIPTQSKPVRVGTNQPLRSAFTPRYPTLTSSVAAVHLIGPRSVYVPQAPAAHTLGAIRSFKTNGSSTANRLGYFQRTASGMRLVPFCLYWRSGSRGKKNMAFTWMSRCEEPCSRRPPYFVVNRYLKWKAKRNC
ncbi:hypothetical protein M513_06902 [Trichuris suis]|uniref:Uncharacterized protein n=1 Tax=Trichuris suis TaxID=68888 RepID=A0A085M4P3_9BILA|nr:hypothetical protein M513_06902 [Trichuris suis]